MSTLVPVILCGGTGTRLWPLSRASYPKQYWALAGDGDDTLLQQTLIKAGVLDQYLLPGGGRSTLLETDPPGLPSLRDAVRANTRIRFDSPLWRDGGDDLSDEALEEAMAPINRWIESRDAWTERANGYLDHSLWSGPPWTPLQWVTLRNVIEMAGEE